MKTVKCRQCKKGFVVASWKSQKFCSKECYAKAHSSREIVICEECGEKFDAPKHKHRQFCSNCCHVKFMIRERDKGKRIWWQCPICKKKFWICKNVAERRKYCSRKCSSVAASYNLRGKRRKEKVSKRALKIYENPARVSDRGKRKLLHRYLMEQKIGRELSSDEPVHHIDMDKNNNVIENLWLYKNTSEHIKGHYSLVKLVSELMSKGIIEFVKGKYQIGGGRGNGTGRK